MASNLLTIAGSDPSGGAGVQADLKTFSALGCYGMSVITALTAQNTQGVSGVYEIPADFVKDQIVSVFDDIRVDAVKIGMVGSVEVIDVIAAALERYRPRHVVVDPVMVATGGDRLISNEAALAMSEKLIPLADVITPNIPEAQILLGRSYKDDLEEMARELLTLGSRAVLLKGGHLQGEVSRDALASDEGTWVMDLPRIKTINTHGTGCTLSSALAAFLANGLKLEDAAGEAKYYITSALRHADELEVSSPLFGGHGPVHHFYRLWEE